MITLTKLALLLHLFIETPASLSFLLAPRSQLPGASPEAVLILHNFGGLLASTNLVVLVLILSLSPGSATELLAGRLCLCLGTYHVWPIRRAWVRMRSSSISSHGKVGNKVLGGPAVHFMVHAACLVALLGAGLAGLLLEG